MQFSPMEQKVDPHLLGHVEQTNVRLNKLNKKVVDNMVSLCLLDHNQARDFQIQTCSSDKSCICGFPREKRKR